MPLPLSRQTILTLVLLLVLAIGGGVVAWRITTLNSEIARLNQEVVRLNTENEKMAAEKDALHDQWMNETVWYEIPELGIRFPTDRETKEDLVYYFDEDFSTDDVQLVNFSTKELMEFSQYCSAKNGPLGDIMRVHKTDKIPRDPARPCGSGQKVHDFPGGYFCYTHPQAICSDTIEEFNEHEKQPLEKYRVLFRSKEFWDTVTIE